MNQLSPKQIANWRKAMPQFALCSDVEIQTLRNMMQAKIDSEKIVDDTCDVRGCGKPQTGHGHEDHVYMARPLHR